ncbi:phosphate/phosphite/phosphonate ABC transporter substrate-binding protein [Pediococcus pentosaceus]|uniref:Phosphate/phosphite/phosphonate ABC transporter substrate-binding protein n=1 Tax=Pediococcus pentosaceus TaxID=1255 RepID=A0A6L4ZZQ5_PEDPE|nr:phosphate/phosphite/phosphonate ABC transporter substrate-binding protein [Pediococcus pentosaceus]KAF0412331.1 phosphate/phosphite/phosphonate ABC transporter substrate-binding protein [Pediococcus pentosaceus]KAF0420764.1 phosphate/phosphite/phosphonate ABC transporter substrate-binding protein [Pediococcus pentosaceus]KAF0420782.1 phosphate/phosphite/phosphonate ABC transporter substrate-binding protein [Pediococcus pentosaceus]KAF0433587.1 phosphate/phosphite/phosphonate ABC transporter 
MKFYKKAAVVASSLLCAISLAACGNSKSSKDSDTYTPKELTVQFVPSSNATTIEAKAKPLEGLLKKELGIPVKVSVSTDYNTIVEAMGSKKVDVGFLPPDAYVLAHKQNGAKVILQAQRNNMLGADDHYGNKKVDFYRSQIIVRKDSGIKSIKDLKGKKIAVQDTTSTAGWIYPAVEMYKKGVNINKSGIKTVQVKGHDQGVLSVYNKNTDAAFVFQGARNLVKGDAPDVNEKLVSIYQTKKIPNDTISVRGDMSPKWQKKVAKAFKAIAKTKKGHKIISTVYSHEGYTDSKDSNFDIIRQYDKTAEKLDK